MFDNIFGDNTAQNNANQTQNAPQAVNSNDMFSPPTTSPPPTQPEPASQPPAPAASPQVPPAPSPNVSPVVPPAQQEEISVVLFDEAYKDKIGMHLTERMLKAVEEGELTETEMGVISGYILDNMDNIRTHADLMVFLQGLSQRFRVFKQLFKVEKGIDKESKEDDKAQAIASLIKENKIDEALTAAQNATGGVS